MAQKSNLNTPSDEPIILVKKSLVDLTQCTLQAALINYFDYWHFIKKESNRQGKHLNKVASNHGDFPAQDVSLLQYHTLSEIEDAMMGIAKLSKIRTAIAILEERGFISRHKNPNPKYKFDRTTYYQFHPEVVNHAIAETRMVMHLLNSHDGDVNSTDGDVKTTNDLYTETTNKDYLTETNSNQADKAFCENAIHAANFGKRYTAKKQEQPNTPKSMPTVNQPSAVGGINPRQDNYSAKFSKKEKQAKVAFRHDRYGVLQFPAAKKYKLPSILAMRSMQFLLAKELECEFAVDADGAVWVCDPKMGDWLSEEEMFGGGSDHEQGHLSLKKMVSILNGDTAPSQLDIDWFNKTAKWYFHFWHGHCQQLGENAPSVIGQQSVGLWLQQLDADFEIELADLDEVA